MSDQETTTPVEPDGASGSTQRGEGLLRRDISRLGFTALTLNSVIGAGIFGLPAVAAAAVGDFSPWMFVICGVLTLTIVLSFARASSLVRETGGVIVEKRRFDLRSGDFRSYLVDAGPGPASRENDQ